jgi:hypothetical protein
LEKNSEILRVLRELEFSEDWFDGGFASSEKLIDLWADFQNSDDKNKEHYRWRAFKNYLENHNSINENKLRELYRLGEIDADIYGMGMSMRIDILQRKDCPADLIAKALNSGEKPLIKVAERKVFSEKK